MSKNNSEKLLNASDVMTEYTEQSVNDKEQKEAYKGYLQLDNETAKELAEVEQTSAVSEKFENLTDEELEDLYENALDADEANRTDEQKDLLEQTKERYLKIKFYREFEDASKWFETEYPEKDFTKIVGSNAFLEFAAGIKLPIRELVRRFLKMTEIKETKQPVASTGSVKNYGTTVEKDYFSPAEVDRMTEEEIERNLESIK
ncbi:MAG: hypothetical protein UH854_06915, partial [Clostridia bacterium]|nr:hypothetical protein [Clostridia bacterium]